METDPLGLFKNDWRNGAQVPRNPVNQERYKLDLIRESAVSVFTKEGKLTDQAVSESRRITPGDRIWKEMTSVLVKLRPGDAGAQVPLRSDVEHVVLEIWADHQGENFYRIEPRDGGAPALHNVSNFEVTVNHLPSFWVVQMYGDGSLAICPQGWTAQGFWEAYFDREEWAVQEYRRWRDEMLKELPEWARY